MVEVNEKALQVLLGFVIDLSLRPEVGLRGEAKYVLKRWDELRNSTIQEQIKEAKAKELYNDYSSNHPTIHTNRFPSWSELSDLEKENWAKKSES